MSNEMVLTGLMVVAVLVIIGGVLAQVAIGRAKDVLTAVQAAAQIGDVGVQPIDLPSITGFQQSLAQARAEIQGVASKNLTDMAEAVAGVQYSLDDLREEIRKVNLGAGALVDTKINSIITQTAHELMRLRQDTVNALQGIRNRADAADASVSKMASELELRIADGVAQASKQLPEAATPT